ncbi:sigma-70 family RNA polymerase sigma factor [Nakamurella silvestris]|nr:sigma-70 family RNA polymerase sigma factor [Nakamurella silvestris]
MEPRELERVLLERARSGDDRAFEELVGLHKRHIWAVCVRITRNSSDAEDALQDALTAAWQHIGKFRGEAKFSTWLHRIAANAALAVVRRRKDVALADVQPEGVEVADDGPDPYERIAQADRVQAALAELPENFRVAIVLREYGDMTYDEIAVHQGVPVQTVKSRINRARTALATILLASSG